jgi:lipopolysaccharide transport system permease protein
MTNSMPQVHRITSPQLKDLWLTLQLLPSQLNLLRIFVWRTISVRYKQSILGILWVALQPIATTAVIGFMFSIIGADTSGGAPKGLFLFVGVMLWQFFSRAVQDGTLSLLANSAILTKIFVPRILFPMSSVISAWVDLVVMMIFLMIACMIYQVPVSGKLLLFPIFLILISLAAFSVAIILAPVNALYRDVSFIIPFALQFGMFLTPVLYTSEHVPEKWRVLYSLNPLVSLLEGARWSLFPQSAPPDPVFLAINVLTIFVALLLGFVFFHRLESNVVDRI